MTERADARDPLVDGADPGIDDLTRDILPALIARLRASRLGELEVRTATWRVRVRRELRAPRRAIPSDGAPEDEPREVDPASGPARSPAVGYFNPLPGIAVGQIVAAGDPMGSVDMLGIAQDVLAPGGGIVRAILAEPGQAVEYGQPLVEIDALDIEAPEAQEVGSGTDAETIARVSVAPSVDGATTAS